MDSTEYHHADVEAVFQTIQASTSQLPPLDKIDRYTLHSLESRLHTMRKAIDRYFEIRQPHLEQFTD